MIAEENIIKNQKVVRVLAWTLIVMTSVDLLKSLIFLNGYSAMITMQQMTKNYDPPVNINFAQYFILNAVESLLCVVVFASATFVLKYKNLWRKVLIYGLAASIIFLMISPLINYYSFPGVEYYTINSLDTEMLGAARSSILIASYIWSVLFTIFFIVVIKKFSKDEVRILFK